MKVDNVQGPQFKGALDGFVTTTLRTLDKNPMVNAVGIDLVAMVGPRTYVDTMDRNEYAGAETFFREFTGTLTVCLSASYFAKWLSMALNKQIMPDNKINTNSWYTKDGLDFLMEANKGTKNTKEFVSNVFDAFPSSSFTGELVDESKWSKFKWDNPKYDNIHKKLNSKDALIDLLTEVIEDKTLSKSDRSKLVQILDLRVTNLTNNDSVNLSKNGKTFSTSISNLMRDTIDAGRDIITKPQEEQLQLLKKINKVNKIKTIGALTLASSLGLINQYVNRKITEKRTGTKGFVGDINYQQNVKDKQSTKDKSLKFILEKIAASVGMAAMAIAVMKVKSPSDFMKKLEFTGPVNSGNVIKTIYASTLIGRFLASDNKDELRETVTRDYLGFLNWLVLGGFASKGVANMLDPERENLFKGNTKGKGVKNWLNNISLKSHNEIAVAGKDFAKKNMWKLNLAHISGLAYSTIALGILLPKLNIWLTNKKQAKKENKLVA